MGNKRIPIHINSLKRTENVKKIFEVTDIIHIGVKIESIKCLAQPNYTHVNDSDTLPSNVTTCRSASNAEMTTHTKNAQNQRRPHQHAVTIKDSSLQTNEFVPIIQNFPKEKPPTPES